MEMDLFLQAIIDLKENISYLLHLATENAIYLSHHFTMVKLNGNNLLIICIMVETFEIAQALGSHSAIDLY